jgi:chromosome segregation ATPase
MGKISDLVRTVADYPWVEGPKLVEDDIPDAPSRPRAQTEAQRENAALAEVGARIGEENEVLRNLLVDTSHQLDAIDDLKKSFNGLVDPLNSFLSALEHERADNASCRGALTALRGNHEKLRAEFQALEKKSFDLEVGNEGLGRSLASAVQQVQVLEEERTKLNSEKTAQRAALAQATKQLADEAAKVRRLSDEKALLGERLDASDKRIVALEAELAQARERVALLENDSASLRAALDKTLAESSRSSRLLAESNSALADIRANLEQTERSLALTEAERIRLVTACDEANERRQSEVYALELKLDGLRSRTDTAEKMLASMRQSFAAAGEELRGAEAKLFETANARSEAEKQVAELTALNEAQQQQNRLLEQELADLRARWSILSQDFAATERSRQEAEERISSLMGQVEQLQSESATYRGKAEEDFVRLSAAIEQERSERAVAEAALARARKDYNRLQMQTTQDRSIRRASS